MKNEIEAWHFVGGRLRDGRPIPPDGKWLEHDGELKLQSAGLHASIWLMGALCYAPSHTLCRVLLAGEIKKSGNNLVARRRKIIWRIDATDVLREAARISVLRAVDLWDCPDIVRKFLETGDGSIRGAACIEARAAVDATDNNTAYAAAKVSDYKSAAAEPYTAARRAVACDAAEPYTSAYYAAFYKEREQQDTLLTDLVMAEHNRLIGGSDNASI